MFLHNSSNFEGSTQYTILFLFCFQTELKDLKKRLRSSEEEVKKLESDNSKYFSALKDVQTKIATVVGSNAAEETIEAAAATVNGKAENNSL